MNEREIIEPNLRRDLKQRLLALPTPDRATTAEAIEVFNRINSGDLEYFYPLQFGTQSLGETARAWLHGLGSE